MRFAAVIILGFASFLNGGFGGRVEVGRSEEGTVIRLRMDQVFQYARGSLMHGQDQVALR